MGYLLPKLDLKKNNGSTIEPIAEGMKRGSYLSQKY